MTSSDSHPERTAALLTALGPDRLAGLHRHFRADLDGLIADAAALSPGDDSRTLHPRAHRLHGSASSLGLDATALALGELAERLSAGAVPAAALMALLDAAETGRARAWAVLAPVLPGLAEAHAPSDSKR